MLCRNFVLSLSVCVLLLPMVASADFLPLNEALRATYVSCVGIDNELSELKKMAGINTAVTGVGTAVNTSATVVGIIKAAKDKQAEELERLIKELAEMEDDQEAPTDEQIAEWGREFDKSYESGKSAKTLTTKLDKLNKQSKKLGNWRTGLLAGGTVTNVAGAVIASKNKVSKDLQTQINDCKASIKNLRDSVMQARLDGEDVTEANNIVDACGKYESVDVSKINNRATGAMWSSIVGATTGVAGTVTSAIANTDATRNDNSNAGKQKEKNLNTASNVLAGASTAASVTATVFNATQISAIKKVSAVAEKCTEVLK